MISSSSQPACSRLASALWRRPVLLLALACCLALPALAQRGGGPPGGGGPGGGPPQGPPPGQGGFGGGQNFVPRTPQQPEQSAGTHSGLQLGPPGRWWDDKSIARSLKLKPDQQTRMDSIFQENRSALLSRFDALQSAEAQLQQLTHAPALDEVALFAQIDRVAQARAELEKANTHMLLLIRKELDAKQITRLEEYH